MCAPFLSVIVPVYNALPYLHECINSLLAQMFCDLEIVLIDDGSTDGSGDVCAMYASDYKQIKLLRQEHHGVVRARQAGARAAAGAYIGFVDADDWVEPAMFERLCSAARLHKADFVVCDYVRHAQSALQTCGLGLDSRLYEGHEFENTVLLSLFCCPNRMSFCPLCTQWNAIVAADRAKAELCALPQDLVLGEDTAFAMGCALGVNRFVYVNEPLYHYRILSGSASHRDWCNRPEELSRQRELFYYHLRQRAQARLISHILGQLESYMLFLALYDLRHWFSGCDDALHQRYLSAPWLAKLLKKELENPLQDRWAEALGALHPQSKSRRIK